MDKSTKFRKMCEKAVEIQNKKWSGTHEEKIGSWFAERILTTIEDYLIRCYDPRWSFNDITYETVIWLPRQDQLQEMLIPKPYRDWANLLSFFFDWSIDANCIILNQFNSMEQLWLAFVMHEKFNKRWNGEDWEEI